MKKLISLLMIAAMILAGSLQRRHGSIGFFHVVRHGKHCFRRGERSV